MKKQEIGKTEFFQSRYFPLESFIRKNFFTLSHRILQRKQGISENFEAVTFSFKSLLAKGLELY